MPLDGAKARIIDDRKLIRIELIRINLAWPAVDRFYGAFALVQRHVILESIY